MPFHFAKKSWIPVRIICAARAERINPLSFVNIESPRCPSLFSNSVLSLSIPVTQIMAARSAKLL